MLAELGVEDHVAMLPETLERAEGPAETLAHEGAHAFGGFSPCESAGGILDDVAALVEAEGEVGILGEGIEAKAAGIVEGLAADGADGAGDDGDAIPLGVSAAVEIEAADVFEGLAAGDEGAEVADLRVAGDGADLRVAEGFDQLLERLAGEVGICVEEDEGVIASGGDAGAKGLGFAAVLLADEADAAVDESGFLDLADGLVLRAVIDDDDLELAHVGGIGHGAQGGGDDFFLIESGNNDAEGRGVGLAGGEAADAAVMTGGEDGDHDGADDDEGRGGDHECPAELDDEMPDTEAAAGDQKGERVGIANDRGHQVIA